MTEKHTEDGCWYFYNGKGINLHIIISNGAYTFSDERRWTKYDGGYDPGPEDYLTIPGELI